MRVRVQGSGFRVQGSGFRVQGLAFRVQALEHLGVQGRGLQPGFKNGGRWGWGILISKKGFGV